MTFLQRFRPALFVIGGLLVVASLLGARLLAHGNGSGSGSSASSQPSNGKSGSGPVVVGYVDTDPPPVSFLLPPVLQSGEVVKVYITGGQEVEAGAELYKFDTTIMEADLATAERAVDVARVKVRQAKAMMEQHLQKIRVHVEVVRAAATKEFLSLKGYHTYEKNLRANLAGQFKPEEIQKKVDEDAKLFELETLYRTAKAEHGSAKAALQALETAAADTQAAVDEAEAEVQRYESLVKKARVAIDLCTVRSKVAGTIERINVSPGDVLGLSTRTPAVVLIPRGPRVVRAEVEADFAHRVSTDTIGKTVTISDNTDPNLTYQGTVKRIGGAFLAKRSSGEGFVPNETRVLEAVIEVTDPAPPNRPPLRVGQKVRVNFAR